MARGMLAISHGCISLIEKAGQFAVFIFSSSGVSSVSIQMIGVFTVKLYDFATVLILRIPPIGFIII